MHDSAGAGVATANDRQTHRALTARVLRIDRAAWDHIMDRFHASVAAEADDIARLGLLGELFTTTFPESAAFEGARSAAPCPACGAEVQARYRREVAALGTLATSYTYAVCDHCRHAVLVGGTADLAIYSSPAYYQAQGDDGVGYAAYETERAYRESKGERLARWALDHVATSPVSLLEVGSGFGFTRRGAERLGLRTAGVDLNPTAADAALRLYGMSTTTGTLADAVASGALTEGSYDLVLYDFVLEHLADPVRELRLASRMLAPGGAVIVRVPGMDALEIDPFGSFYRSFRNDHLHLFTRASMERMLNTAGLAVTAYETTCGADLLREVLPYPALLASYAAGRGPDITICATRDPHASPSRHPA